MSRETKELKKPPYLLHAQHDLAHKRRHLFACRLATASASALFFLLRAHEADHRPHAAQPVAARGRCAARHACHQRRVKVVEDRRSHRRTLRAQLRGWGFKEGGGREEAFQNQCIQQC